MMDWGGTGVAKPETQNTTKVGSPVVGPQTAFRERRMCSPHLRRGHAESSTNSSPVHLIYMKAWRGWKRLEAFWTTGVTIELASWMRLLVHLMNVAGLRHSLIFQLNVYFHPFATEWKLVPFCGILNFYVLSPQQQFNKTFKIRSAEWLSRWKGLSTGHWVNPNIQTEMKCGVSFFPWPLCIEFW